MEFKIEIDEGKTILHIQKITEGMLPRLILNMRRAVDHVRRMIDLAIANGTYGIKTDTGQLRRSLAVAIEAEGNSVWGKVGSNLKYAGIHEHGGIIKHPGGTAYIIIDGGVSVFIKNTDVSRMETLLHRKLKRTKKHNITMPAHWYMRNTLISEQPKIMAILKEGLVA